VLAFLAKVTAETEAFAVLDEDEEEEASTDQVAVLEASAGSISTQAPASAASIDTHSPEAAIGSTAIVSVVVVTVYLFPEMLEVDVAPGVIVIVAER